MTCGACTDASYYEASMQSRQHTCERVLRPAKSLQRYPFVVERLRVTAPVSRGEVIGSKRFFKAPELLKDIASIELRFCVWRTAPGGFFIGRESIFVASELFHGGKVEIARPRLRSFDGKEQALPSWEGAMTEDWLGKWAMNQMLINVSTRKFERSMRLPEGDVPAPNGSGLSKSAASRRFVALSAARLKEWMGSDLSDLGLLVIQIDGIHMDEDMTLVAAIGRRRQGRKAPSQSRPTSRTRLGGCCRLDPGRARRDAHRNKARTAAGTAAFARLHEHHRECHGHGAARQPERKILALAFDGSALGRRGHAGSRQGL